MPRLGAVQLDGGGHVGVGRHGRTDEVEPLEQPVHHCAAQARLEAGRRGLTGRRRVHSGEPKAALQEEAVATAAVVL
jgi:hypothetical protein